MTDNGNSMLRVGIDLGTSRSSVSASNGERHVVDSYVGWPVDMVARKVLKRDVLIGRDALDNRSMLELHRPLEEGLIKEGSSKDEAAVRELLRHLLALAKAESRRGPTAASTPSSGCPPRRCGSTSRTCASCSPTWSTA